MGGLISDGQLSVQVCIQRLQSITDKDCPLDPEAQNEQRFTQNIMTSYTELFPTKLSLVLTLRPINAAWHSMVIQRRTLEPSIDSKFFGKTPNVYI